MNASLTITQDFSLSPDGVKALVAQGHDIIVTPHIGNRTRTNMFNPHMGVKIIELTTNQSILDTVYKPESVRLDDTDYRIALGHKMPRMSPYILPASNLPTKLKDVVKSFPKSSPAQMHFNTAQEIIGKKFHALEAEIFLDTRLPEVWHSIEKSGIHIFDRLVTDDGIVKNDVQKVNTAEAIDSFIALNREHVRMILNGTSNGKGGYMLSNVACIFSHMILALFNQFGNGLAQRNAKMATCYTMSGPLMMYYMKEKKNEELISKMYEASKISLKFIPECVDFRFIAGGIMKFMPAEDETIIVYALKEFTKIFAQIKLITKTIAEKRGKCCDDLIHERQSLNRKLSMLKRQILPILSNIPTFSQYDALYRNTRLACIEDINMMTFAEMEKFLLKP